MAYFWFYTAVNLLPFYIICYNNYTANLHKHKSTQKENAYENFVSQCRRIS